MKLVTSSLLLSLLLPIAVACTAGTEPEPNDEPTESVDDEIKLGKKKSCASLGGTCVGLSPSSCTNGTWANAKQVSCGGGIGVGCCIEKPTPPPPAEPCPTLSPPAPSFCPNGTITPKKNDLGCTVGYTCTPATPNACEAAGGACVGLSPSSCANGTWADASKYSCGGGLGVGCCVQTCPTLSPPAPSFCPNGTITPKKNDLGCTIGYTCTPSTPNACEAAGGACVGLSPSSCTKGTWGDANTYSCGGGIGVGCCLP